MTVLLISAFTQTEKNTWATGDLAAWSEEKLLAAAKSGHAAAFGELCERHTKKIFRTAQQITRNREDAEDAVQDSFLSAFVHLKDFDGRSRFATWLTRIAVNSALGVLRKKGRKREVSMDDVPSPAAEPGRHFEVPDKAPNPEETYRLCERKEIVGTAIGGLRPRTRKVVEFHRLQEHSIKETAQILGLSTAAVKARMFHARAALRRMPLLRSVGRSTCASAG